jgi:ParB-like chromosome segregation protein Spo0J
LGFPLNKVGKEKGKARTIEQNRLTPLLVIPAEEQKMESAAALKMGIPR